jgi:hypothetical protein
MAGKIPIPVRNINRGEGGINLLLALFGVCDWPGNQRERRRKLNLDLASMLQKSTIFSKCSLE